MLLTVLTAIVELSISYTDAAHFLRISETKPSSRRLLLMESMQTSKHDYNPLTQWFVPVFRDKNIRFGGTENNGSRWRLYVNSTDYGWISKLMRMDNADMLIIPHFNNLEIIADAEILRSLFRDEELDARSDASSLSEHFPIHYEMNAEYTKSEFDNRTHSNQSNDINKRNTAMRSVSIRNYNKMIIRGYTQFDYVLMVMTVLFVLLLLFGPLIFVLFKE